jgi:two-component system NtrC family sensor kinase
MPLRLSLIVKLTLATSLILIGFMSLLDYVNLKYFRQVMIEYTTSTTGQLAEIIKQSTHDTMMKNDKASLRQVIGRIARDSSIEHIRLIDREGKVAYSSVENEVGTVITKDSETCIACHEHGNPRPLSTSMNSSRLYRTAAGMEVMGFTKAIYNQPECSTGPCHFHDREQKVLGVLDITVSLRDLQQRSHEYRMQFIVMTCMLLLLIGTLITLMIQRLVNNPVQRLVWHTAKVASGNLDARVQFNRNDELGDLASALNQMTQSLGKAHEELKEWADSLEHKVEERSQEITQMQAQLHRSQKLASLGNLVAGIAHEINNPLSGVLLYASLVDNDSRLDPVLKPDLERVISECRRCADIVKQLLEFSREAVPHKEAASLNLLLDKVVSLLQHQPTFQNIEIRKLYDQGLDDIFVDAGQMQQVFVNLFINASHAMPDGGSIEIATLRKDNAFACVEITDSGCGIAGDDLQRIFDPFFTTKAEGTGLGLSISYGFVENNSGKIEVKSTVGKGTTFTILLPFHGGPEAGRTAAV